MPRKAQLLITLMLLVALSSFTTFAQGRKDPAPAEGDIAVGGSLGFSNAFDSDFDGTEPIFSGTFEYWLRDRIALRGMLGFTEFEGPNDFDVEVTIINGNILYSWNKGLWHPYVTGGVGLYDVDPDFGSDDLEIGLNFGGGFFYSFDPSWAVTAEGLFHGSSGDGPDSFFTGTGGIKYFF